MMSFVGKPVAEPNSNAIRERRTWPGEPTIAIGRLARTALQSGGHFLTDSGRLLLTATGEATLMSGIASLPLNVNLGSKSLGRCNLEIRKNTGEWNSFPLVLR